MRKNLSNIYINPIAFGIAMIGASVLFSLAAYAGDAAKATDSKIQEIKTSEAKPAAGSTAAPTATQVAAPADADFKKLDGNADGKLSIKEAGKDKTLASVFEKVDANQDGMVSTDEYATYKVAASSKPVDVPVTY